MAFICQTTCANSIKKTAKLEAASALLQQSVSGRAAHPTGGASEISSYLPFSSTPGIESLKEIASLLRNRGSYQIWKKLNLISKNR